MSNILVYADAGVSQSALAHTLQTLRKLLPSYDVQTVTARTLALDPWEGSTSLLVLPGGRDLPYVERLAHRYPVPSRDGSTSCGVEKIERFVRHAGGAFIGICAGAYYASAVCDFEKETPLQVVGRRDGLRFFPGTCQGTVYPGFVYESDAGSRIVRLRSESSNQGGKLVPAHWTTHYNGGGAFMDADSFRGQGVEVLARYEAGPQLAGGEASTYANQAAAVLVQAGQGKALLFGTHPEFPLHAKSRPVRLSTASDAGSLDEAQLQQEEILRLATLAAILQRLGLATAAQPPSPPQQQPSITTPPRLTPLVLCESKQGAVTAVLETLRALKPRADQCGLTLCATAIQDGAAVDPTANGHDAQMFSESKLFAFADVEDCFEVYAEPDEQRLRALERSLNFITRHADYRPYVVPPPAAAETDAQGVKQQEQDADADTAESESNVNLVKVPKIMLAYPHGQLPSSALTPHFNAAEFITSLHHSRTLFADRPVLSATGARQWHERSELADCFAYGQVVTSTQTILNQNFKLLQRLPNGFTAIATHQVAGRGRGKNSWISPLGCLQFSTVLHLPASLGAGVVFLQYLAGLAIVLAVRQGLGPEYAPVGQRIRIKWPNDVYAQVADIEAEGEPERKGTFTLGGARYAKLAGVLVNSQFAGKEFALIVGCGINCLNSRPSTSLSDLIASHNAALRAGGSQQPPLAPVSQERLLGAILATFEQLWNVFLQTGTFEAFTRLYADVWLHSNQEITLADRTPAVQARIVGISSDYGLLRAVPLETRVTSDDAEAWGKKTADAQSTFIDLQPDGNSFDMLQNLIRAK